MATDLKRLWMFETPNDPIGPYANLTKLGAFVDMHLETDQYYSLRELYVKFQDAEPCGELTFPYKDFLRAVRYWGYRVQDRPRPDQEKYAHLPKRSTRRVDHYIARRKNNYSARSFANPVGARNKGAVVVAQYKLVQEFVREYIAIKGAVTLHEIMAAYLASEGVAITKSVVRSAARNQESMRVIWAQRDGRRVELVDPVPYGLPLLTKMSNIFAAMKFPVRLDYLHERFEQVSKLKLSRKKFIAWARSAGVEFTMDFDPIIHRQCRMAILKPEGMAAKTEI